MSMAAATQQTVAELADYLVERMKERASSSDRRVIVAVSGTPGSGKSHLSELVSAAVNTRVDGAPVATVLPMDGFHLTKAQLASMDDPALAMLRRGAPWTFDSQAFVELVRRVRGSSSSSSANGEATVWAPSFDHAVGDPVPGAIAIEPHHRVVIIEGLYAHVSDEPWAQLESLVDERWWVEPRCKTQSRERLVQRHLRAGLAADRAAAENRIDGNDGLNGEYAAARRLTPTRIVLN
ncbi:hypothetical protein GGI07_003162 [Coemansia sp. Benny D115]|nr:hypothetical protein GGI07_003162 [Coemansia sp. Benny D115]